MTQQEWGDDGALWTAIRWIHKRRPLLTAIFVVVLVAAALVGSHPPADLIRRPLEAISLTAWILMILGVGIRIWGAGNLRKNQEITSTGVYRTVRHPLYAGSLAMFLALFLTVGDPRFGLALFVAMVLLVYYPTMVDEEALLRTRFPEQTEHYLHLRRLVPSPSRLPEALRTDRFSLRSARGNFGLRSLGFLLALPLLLEILRWLRTAAA